MSAGRKPVHHDERSRCARGLCPRDAPVQFPRVLARPRILGSHLAEGPGARQNVSAGDHPDLRGLLSPPEEQPRRDALADAPRARKSGNIPGRLSRRAAVGIAEGGARLAGGRCPRRAPAGALSKAAKGNERSCLRRPQSLSAQAKTPRLREPQPVQNLLLARTRYCGLEYQSEFTGAKLAHFSGRSSRAKIAVTGHTG